MSQACKGDDDAFAEIVRRHNRKVFRVISRFFRNPSQVEDMAQDVFVKAYTQLSSYQGKGSFEGWLSRIATNTCLNELRTQKRHPESLASDMTDGETSWLDEQPSKTSSSDSPEAKAIAADLADKILERLSPEDRMVLTLTDGEELSIKEVAELTGWSQAKVKVQAFRARRRMRKVVEQLLDQ